MHYKEPFKLGGIAETDDACIAGCYRCILSYFNQPDHELINRRSDNVISLLCDLTSACESKSTQDSSAGPWDEALQKWGLPEPSTLSIKGISLRLFWPAKAVLAVPGGASSDLVNEAAALGILDVIDLPDQPAEQAPDELLSALGVAR
jgi:hypothetical protein